MKEDTIVALSTPPGYGGLGIVRLSGPRALSISKRIFKPKKTFDRFPPRQPVLGNIFDAQNHEAIEEAMMTFFPAPQTFTREDMVEISCHGSPVILEEVIRLAMAEGARHSDPGEFTLRAYLHGRIDILQAEAIHDLIHASSLIQARISFRQLEGTLSQKMQDLRLQIIDLLSSVEASLEFPEEALEKNTPGGGGPPELLIKATQTVRELVESYSHGRTYSEGLNLVLAGRTNVGKSTLFNALLEKDRSIVTPLPGTTRDYLQEKIKIKDALFTLTDMAGWNKTFEPAEREGIAKGKRLAFQADGALILLDSSQVETDEDFQLIEILSGKKKIILFNKTDLPSKMDQVTIRERYKEIPAIEISALTGKNLDKLKDMIHTHFVPTYGQGQEVILHLRQKLALENILASFEEGARLLKEGYPEEIFSEEIRKAIPLIGELTGEIQSEEIIHTIFSRFCVGK